MADPQVLTTLRRKRDEIESVIVTYRAKIEEAERDLSAVAATIRLFELNGEPQQFPAYVEIGRTRFNEILKRHPLPPAKSASTAPRSPPRQSATFAATRSKTERTPTHQRPRCHPHPGAGEDGA